MLECVFVVIHVVVVVIYTFVSGECSEPAACTVQVRTETGGAWMCAESTSCFEAAMKVRAFDRAWKTRSSEKKTINGRHLTRVAQP